MMMLRVPEQRDTLTVAGGPSGYQHGMAQSVRAGALEVTLLRRLGDRLLAASPEDMCELPPQPGLLCDEPLAWR